MVKLNCVFKKMSVINKHQCEKFQARKS